MLKLKKRYSQVGMGARSRMYIDSIVGDYKDCCELVAICDVNRGRLDLANRHIVENGGSPVPTHLADDFDRMVAETKPDVVIVTTGPDVTHSDYICRAMELGCDVVTEKPMTSDETRCRKILKTAAETGRNLQVTFNYRYSPPRSQIKEMIVSGAIGEILGVDFAWLLDTRHGADYFRRWHRRRENSGSLLVHKATHHFDLVNWWLGDDPEEVFCHASLKYYTPATSERMGLAGRSERCRRSRFYHVHDRSREWALPVGPSDAGAAAKQKNAGSTWTWRIRNI
ncbi:MAG: Gfo/Idh/MocA family oxidoreductase [Planctomycetota bacterium]|nr:Gfo/Idh/MocA family oxidoreductase [Planctomycetota bacterium]